MVDELLFKLNNYEAEWLVRKAVTLGKPGALIGERLAAIGCENAPLTRLKGLDGYGVAMLDKVEVESRADAWHLKKSNVIDGIRISHRRARDGIIVYIRTIILRVVNIDKLLTVMSNIENLESGDVEVLRCDGAISIEVMRNNRIHKFSGEPKLMHSFKTVDGICEYFKNFDSNTRSSIEEQIKDTNIEGMQSLKIEDGVGWFASRVR